MKNARQDKVRPVHNFKVHPDQIKQIGVGEALVFNQADRRRGGAGVQQGQVEPRRSRQNQAGAAMNFSDEHQPLRAKKARLHPVLGA